LAIQHPQLDDERLNRFSSKCLFKTGADTYGTGQPARFPNYRNSASATAISRS